MPKKTRMVFIPELKEQLAQHLETHGSRAQVDEAFAKWEAALPALTPFQRGCFTVFEQVQGQIDKGVADRIENS